MDAQLTSLERSVKLGRLVVGESSGLEESWTRAVMGRSSNQTRSTYYVIIGGYH